MSASKLTPIIVNRVVGPTSHAAQNVGNANTVEFDSDTGFYVDVGDTTQVNDAARMVLLISGADSMDTAGGIVIKASTNSPWSSRVLGDLPVDLTSEADTKALDLDTVSTAQNPVSVIGPLETARFRDTDGYINVEYDTDHDAPGCTLKALAFVVE